VSAEVEQVTVEARAWKAQRDGYRVRCGCGFVSWVYQQRATADLVQREHVCGGVASLSVLPAPQPRPDSGGRLL